MCIVAFLDTPSALVRALRTRERTAAHCLNAPVIHVPAWTAETPIIIPPDPCLSVNDPRFGQCQVLDFTASYLRLLGPVFLRARCIRCAVLWSLAFELRWTSVNFGATSFANTTKRPHLPFEFFASTHRRFGARWNINSFRSSADTFMPRSHSNPFSFQFVFSIELLNLASAGQ